MKALISMTLSGLIGFNGLIVAVALADWSAHGCGRFRFATHCADAALSMQMHAALAAIFVAIGAYWLWRRSV